MISTLSARFDGVQELRRDRRVLIARARHQGRLVLLCHSALYAAQSDHRWAARTVLDRLRAAGADAYVTHELVEHETGLTWVCDGDDGGFLDEWAETCSPISLRSSLYVIRNLARQLDSMHRARVLHLRIRPTCVRVISGAMPLVRLLPFEAVVAQDAMSALHDSTYDDLRFSAPELVGRGFMAPDARSDLYLLGLLAYSLLCGRLPLNAEDTLGWRHAHLAQTPTPLNELRPDIPASIARLIMSLLAKSPEQRPTSARLLADDLQECLDALNDHDRIDGNLSLRSLMGRFALPRRLVGREREQCLLDDMLARIRERARSVVLVHGPSGIGKTALLRDLRSRIDGENSLFAGGKFEQLGSIRPYAALAAVLDDIVRAETLRVGATSAIEWDKALGGSCAVLATLSLELARLAGPLPLLPEVPPEQARQRLVEALLTLFSALCGRWNGIVLFLDDIQWADDETMTLFAAAMAGQELRGVLLVLGRRAEEGEAAPGLPQSWGFKLGAHIERIEVPPMDLGQVRAWLQIALPGGRLSDTMVGQLAQHSTGNPFLLGQTVSALVQQGRLAVDADGYWRLASGATGGIDLPDSAIMAATQRMQALSPQVAEVLGVAAALGRRFASNTLAQASGCTREYVDGLLAPAHTAGLIESGSDDDQWQFVHDRLQLAAYESVDETARAQRHLRIGRALRDGPLAGQSRFEITYHLNRALYLLTEREREILALLNQRAAADARANAAFAQYAALMRAALAALPEQATLTSSQNLALLQDAADAAILERNFQSAEDCLVRAEKLANSPFEHAHNDELRIHSLIARGLFQEALALGGQALRRLGVPVSGESTKGDVLWQLVRFKLALRQTTPEDMLNAPASDDAMHLQTQRLICALLSVAHNTGAIVYAVLGFIGARRSIRHGVTPWCAMSIAVAGQVTAGVFGDIDLGHRLGKVSVRLGQRFGTDIFGQVHLFYTMHWKVPLFQTQPLLWRSYEKAERVGNFEVASFSVCMYAAATLHAMTSVSALGDATTEMQGFAERRGFDFARVIGHTFARVHDTLVRAAPTGPIEPLMFENAGGRLRSNDALYQLVSDELAVFLNLIFACFDDAVVGYCQRIHRNLHRIAGSLSTPVVYWGVALVHANRLLGGMPGRKRLIRSHLAKLRKWSTHCPVNHAHRVASLEAHLAALDGNTVLARQRFSQAIAKAVENGFIGDAAIIAEGLARWHERWGHAPERRATLEQAYALYAKWGANAKLRQLEGDLPHYAAKNPACREKFELDTQTLIKASQAIGGELDQVRVAERLLQQVMENAGARYAALLLESEGRLLLAAERAESGALSEQSIGQGVEQTGLPLKIVEYVQGTSDSVVLEDAYGLHSYGEARRWREREAVSVLCVPVVLAGDCIGALYLENDMVRACFTPDRVTLAGVLASQAAIAISNARLFSEIDAVRENLRQANATLEQRVIERTQELQANYLELARLERQHATDEERQRIMRDLHDGLGSQLFVTLSRVERGEISNERIGQALHECIADMRLALEAMSPDGNDFLDVWANFRYRWEAQLESAHIASTWEDRVPANGIQIAPQVSLQLLRIVQEALTNMLKHAHARNVAVQLNVHQDQLSIDITDDGIGLSGTGSASSRGLHNMRARSSRIGAQLDIAAASPGTRVSVSYPLPA